MITYPPGTTIGEIRGKHKWDGTGWVLITSAFSLSPMLVEVFT